MSSVIYFPQTTNFDKGVNLVETFRLLILKGQGSLRVSIVSYLHT